MNRIPVRALLLLTSLATACTAATRREDGFDVYADIPARAHYSYALPDDAPAALARLLPMALAHWNDALGRRALTVAPTFAAAGVKVHYARAMRLTPHPAHAELLGCQPGFGAVADCAIHLQVPERLDEDLPSVVFLFAQGPLDPGLYQATKYADVIDYLRDKLMLMSLTHEIGHTLGLAHAEDPSCIMAAAPAGDLRFCPAEIKAVKRRLSLAP